MASTGERHWLKITNEGIWITNPDGHSQLLRVDSIVICGARIGQSLMPAVGDDVTNIT